MVSSVPVRVGMRGPLAPYESALHAELAQVGYAEVSSTDVVQAMARLSRWLEAMGLAPDELTPCLVEKFRAVRRRSDQVMAPARRLGPVLRFLRKQGVVPLSTARDGAVEAFPLVVEVGEALAAYLTEARVSCGNTSLFVTARAPFKALSAGSIRAIMRRACQRAGIASVGAHRLRHTLATDLLRAGASLAEIGQVLRHRSQLSTAVYAKVDYGALRALARPWPVGVQ